MGRKRLALTALLAVGLVSSGFAAENMGLKVGEMPTQCGATGLYECYQFVNDTGAAGSTVANGVTIDVSLASATGPCPMPQGVTAWTIPVGQVAWLWSNPAEGGCLVTSATFSVPQGQSAPAIAPSQPVTVASQGTQGSQHTTTLVVTLTGTAAVPTINVQTQAFKKP